MPRPGPWHTPGLNERMRELYERGGTASLSMSAIAGKLNREFKLDLTRNAVIGRCHRLGLVGRPSPIRIKEKPMPKPVRVRVRRVADVPIAPVEPPAPLTPVTIYHLRPGVCSWPLGKIEDQPPYFYCGLPTENERSWCPHHWAKGRVTVRALV